MSAVTQLGAYKVQIMCPKCGWVMSGHGEHVVECLNHECPNYHKLFEFLAPRISLKEIGTG